MGKKFLEGCVWRLESQNKNFSFIITGVAGVFQRGGGGERIIPTRLPCCITRYFFSWIIVVHNLKKKKERKKIFPGDLVSVGTLGNLLYLLAIPLSLILSC